MNFSGIDIFYRHTVGILGLKIMKELDILYVFNRTLSHHNLFLLQGCKFLEADYKYCMQEPRIKFYPLCEQKESCSYLVINDSIHLYLKELFFKIFEDIITAKEGSNSGYRMSMLDNSTLERLVSPTKYTKYKFYNLFNIVSDTSFSKNLISFEIDFTNSPNSAKVNFKYPLYNMLSATHNNTIFGIHLEDGEIKLFKQIYENYIITIIDSLFKEPIKIPKNSDFFPMFYILMSIRLMIKKVYLEEYEIRDNNTLAFSIENYDISNLNTYNEFYNRYTVEEQRLDQQAYQNELQIRQESEPNWLLLKDNEMGKNKQLPAVSENNNIGLIIDSFGQLIEYDYKQYLNKIRKFNTDILVQEQKDNYKILKNDQEWKEIFYLQNLVLNILRDNGGALWYDTRIKKYCFRSKLNGSISEVDSKELGDLLTRALKEKIIHYSNNNKYDVLDYAMEVVLVSKLKGINNQKLSINEKSKDIIKILLFENEIFTIDDDVFDVTKNSEFLKNHDTDLFFTKNRFIANKHLRKLYKEPRLSFAGNREQTFIEKFIYYLVKEDQALSAYIVNWLAYYFQNLKKSKTALVLLGDQEVTQNIFWNIIIKEIFSKQYCTTINDAEQDTALVSDIAKDKLFFHIGDIVDADTKFDDETLALIIKDLLIKPSVTTDTNEEIYIHGQILITAKNPAPYLKKVLSKCTVIDVDDMDTIMEKLDLEDETELEDMILSDLDSFINKLLYYPVIIDNALKKIDTEARQILKGSQSSNINIEDIDKQIDTFIEAIKTKNIDYFEKAKKLENGEQYTHMKNAFEKDDGYFISQYLFDFYNAIHEQKFHKKQEFMDRLKGENDMFKQEAKTLKILTQNNNEDVLFQAVKTSKETANRELYKINNYTMAEDITIPNGATIISSQTTYQRYSFESDEEMESCIQRTKKLREDKAKEKEKK